MRLEGKVAVITGAGQTQGESIGNGRAAAVLFAREGAKLVLANRTMASLEATRELLRKEGFDAECMVADISKEDDCAALVKNAVSRFGRIDILHNNVGIGGRDGDTVDITYEWQGNVNGLGAVYNITNQPQGAIGDFTAVLATRWRSEENVFTLNSCIVSDYEIATKGGDYAKPTLSYQAQADAYDNIGTFSFAQNR